MLSMHTNLYNVCISMAQRPPMVTRLILQDELAAFIVAHVLLFIRLPKDNPISSLLEPTSRHIYHNVAAIIYHGRQDNHKV